MRLGTYTDTLEIENEMLRNKVKELTAQLKPYLDAEQKRLEYLKKCNEIDQGINNIMNLFYNKQYLK